MRLPSYCAPEIPEFCFPDTMDWLALGAGLVAWVFLYTVKWLDPARKAAERISGRPWWRL